MTDKEKKEWERFKQSWAEVVRMFGSLLFMPVFIVIGFGYGIRAGIIEGLSVTLSLFKEWE